MISPYDMTYMIWPISRLNSGIKNRNNFFVWEFFSIQKIGTDSVNQADFGDIRIPWEIDFKIIVRILKLRGRQQNAWVLHSRSHPMCLSFHAGHFRM